MALGQTASRVVCSMTLGKRKQQDTIRILKTDTTELNGRQLKVRDTATLFSVTNRFR